MYHMQVSLLCFYFSFLSFHLFYCTFQSVLPYVTANLSPKALNQHLWKGILPGWVAAASGSAGPAQWAAGGQMAAAGHFYKLWFLTISVERVSLQNTEYLVLFMYLKINVGMICSAVVFSVQLAQVLSILMFIKTKMNVFSRKWHHMIF